jgi:hypothetical protein
MRTFNKTRDMLALYLVFSISVVENTVKNNNIYKKRTNTIFGRNKHNLIYLEVIKA